MKNKRYKITTFEQIQNVITSENKIRFLVDLASYLMSYADMCEATRKNHPDETKGKQNTEIIESHFIWIDDGKEGVTHIEVTNKKTGETKIIKTT